MTKHEKKGRSAQDMINDMRNVVKPKIGRMLLEADYEGMGESDQKEFELEFETILTLAETAFSQQELHMREWIPVAKRLPEVGQRVIVTQMVSDRTVVYCTTFPFEKTKEKYITAWMPLPKPFKGETEE